MRRSRCATIGMIALIGGFPAPAVAAPHPVQAIRLRMTAAANGAILVGVPDAGWSVRVINAGPFTTEIIASPGGRPAPAAIVIAMLGVSDMISGYYAGLHRCQRVAASMFGDVRVCELNNIQHHAMVAQRKWTAVDGMHALAAAAPQFGDNMSNLSARARSSNAADVTYDERLQGATFTDAGVMRMAYPFNPYLSKFESGTPEWVSLGFLSACRAPSGELAGFLPTCRAVLGSIRYSQAFKADLAERAMREYARQVQTSSQLIVQAIQSEAEKEAMVAQFAHQMAALQAQQQQIIQQTSEKVDEGWINTLGGQVNLVDPSSKDIYTVSDDYKYYCLGAGGTVLGTNLAADLQGCQTTLHRQSP
jgi:hypothetical protein